MHVNREVTLTRSAIARLCSCRCFSEVKLILLAREMEHPRRGGLPAPTLATREAAR
jgi:hypothetical protein